MHEEKIKKKYWSGSHFLSTLLKQLPVHVFWKNKSGIYLGCNDIFAKSLGFSYADDLIGKSDYDLPVKKEESDAYRADDLHVMETRIPRLNIEEKQTSDDGKTTYLLTSKIPLIDEHDEVMGILGVYSDITQRKNMEISARLAKDKAEQANNVKTEFLANMSHDVRTPLSGIIGGSELLQYKISEAGLKDIASDILTSGQHLMKFFDDLLEASHLDLYNDVTTKANSNSNSNSFSLEEIAQDLEGLFTMSIRTKSINFTTKYDENLPKTLLGDRASVYRILQNLLGNALKFTPNNGSVTLTFNTLTQTTPKHIIVVILVEDTGIGIPPDQKKKIFEKMYQLSSSYEGVYKGHGMGLYVVKQLLDAMNGTVSVTSEEGKGSCFNVTLPCKLPEGKTS